MESIIPLDISSVSLVNRYLSDFPPKISELTFTNLFAWRQTRPVWLYEFDNTLTFLVKTDICRNDEMLILGSPTGGLSLAQVFDKLGKKIIGAIGVPGDDTKDLPLETFTLNQDRDNFDYIYRQEDLAELKGRKYSKKRSHVKQCLNKYDCSFEYINGQNIDECRELMTRWCNSRECDLDPGLCGESRAITTAIDLFSDFKLMGGAVRVDGLIQAFAIGERLNRSTAVWHFEKALPGIEGLSQLINQWFARECLAEFTYVNREQDLGIPGLRQAKESYHPDHLVEKMTIFRKKAPCF